MLRSGLPEIVGNDEDIARFLTQTNWFKASVVKPAAFLPRPIDQETSVSRHGREPADRLWGLGFEAAGERPLYGAAIFKAAAVRNAQLDVVADEPPIRHAAIRGWPWLEDPDEQKARQKELALLLTRAAGSPFLR